MYARLTQLTNRNVLTIHAMRKNGSTIREIAAAVGLHPNSITQHLRFRVAYPPEVLQRLISSAPKLHTEFPMPLLDAAPLLPGWPSPGKLHDLVAAGAIEAKKQLLERGSQGISCTYVLTEHQLKRAAARIMPQRGVFIRSDALARLAPRAVVRDDTTRHHLAYWPCKRFYWLRASDITDHLSVPAEQVHHAVKCLELTGRATLF